MTLGDIRKMNAPDDTEIEINSVLDEDSQELKPVPCDGFYNEKDKKIYLTPEIIAL